MPAKEPNQTKPTKNNQVNQKKKKMNLFVSQSLSLTDVTASQYN